MVLTPWLTPWYTSHMRWIYIANLSRNVDIVQWIDFVTKKRPNGTNLIASARKLNIVGVFVHACRSASIPSIVRRLEPSFPLPLANSDETQQLAWLPDWTYMSTCHGSPVVLRKGKKCVEPSACKESRYCMPQCLNFSQIQYGQWTIC
jgi:hypothetical protein